MYQRNLNFLCENELPYLMRFEPFNRKINASLIFPSYMGGGEEWRRRRRRRGRTPIKAVRSRSSLYRDDLPTIKVLSKVIEPTMVYYH